MQSRFKLHECDLSGWILVGLAACVSVIGATTAGADAPEPTLAQGRALFTREWLPGDPGGHSGDGLGPVYNDTSCTACHNQGGVGGAGSKSKNVDFLTAIVTPVEGEPEFRNDEIARMARQMNALRRSRSGETQPGKPRVKGEDPDRGPLLKLHRGFRDASSLVLHRFGPGPNYEAWRMAILNPEMSQLLSPSFALFRQSQEQQAIEMSVNQIELAIPMEYGHFTLIPSQLNPPALFGTGLIDKVPDTVLEDAARSPDPRFFAIKGRVCRLADGRIGRFGWKAEHASLDEFVQTACAVELGLEVPGRHQGIKPFDADDRAPGLDLSQEECNALFAFVRSLPAPGQRRPTTQREMEAIRSGREAFDQIGCAACHRPKLGPIDGIYSDLLLHDMGESLSNRASYGSHLPDSAEESGPLADADFPSGADAFAGAPPRARPPLRREWRTPPLWGLRDSAPYMHDGRAETLEQAIVLHGGQADSVKNRYFHLRPEQRLGVLLFLKTLVAPSAEANAERAQIPDVLVHGPFFGAE